MAFRPSLARLAESGGGGLRGFFERLKLRVTTGKILRPMDEYDVVKRPTAETQYRYPSPGSQPEANVPQGSYEKVFDIAYYSRDLRRKHGKEMVSIKADPLTKDLPPTPGRVILWEDRGDYAQYIAHEKAEEKHDREMYAAQQAREGA